MKIKELKNKDLIFVCKKCGHNLFVSNKNGWVKKIINLDCPNCGEEPEENWIFGRLGNWEKFNKEK